MAKGTVALIGWLFIISATLIVFVSVLVVLTGTTPVNKDGNPLTFGEIIWMNLMRAMDAGALGGDSGSWFFLLTSLNLCFKPLFRLPVRFFRLLASFFRLLAGFFRPYTSFFRLPVSLDFCLVACFSFRNMIAQVRVQKTHGF